MSVETTLYEIPNFEFNAIKDLFHARYDNDKDNLSAVIAFGDIKTQGNTFDIDLLEVRREAFGCPGGVEFESSDALPLRGKLRLYFLSAKEFENPDGIENQAAREWVNKLLSRVREGYQVVYDWPPRYAEKALRQLSSIPMRPNPPSTDLQMSDPLHLPTKRK